MQAGWIGPIGLGSGIAIGFGTGFARQRGMVAQPTRRSRFVWKVIFMV